MEKPFRKNNLNLDFWILENRIISCGKFHSLHNILKKENSFGLYFRDSNDRNDSKWLKREGDFGTIFSFWNKL